MMDVKCAIYIFAQIWLNSSLNILYVVYLDMPYDIASICSVVVHALSTRLTSCFGFILYIHYTPRYNPFRLTWWIMYLTIKLSLPALPYNQHEYHVRCDSCFCWIYTDSYPIWRDGFPLQAQHSTKLYILRQYDSRICAMVFNLSQ